MRAGHSFTRGFKRPFDEVFIKSMQDTAKYLSENIQNCKLSYQQSDEITLLLVDYDKLNTDCFFDYRVDKLCSIAASMATMAFNRAFANNVGVYCTYTYECMDNTHENYEHILSLAVDKGAMFDARCFNIPKEEVTNLLYWRQDDAAKNSIQMVGRAFFSHKELHKKSRNDIQDMLMTQKEINWNDLPTYQKRGSCCVKMYQTANGVFESHAEAELVENGRTYWSIDTNIPIFKGEGREYIDRLVFVGED